jgi:hypothetical protein
MARSDAEALRARIRRAEAGIAAAERELAAARGAGPAREVQRLERELANRRAYLAELVALLRGPARE